MGELQFGNCLFGLKLSPRGKVERSGLVIVGNDCGAHEQACAPPAPWLARLARLTRSKSESRNLSTELISLRRGPVAIELRLEALDVSKECILVTKRYVAKRG